MQHLCIIHDNEAQPAQQVPKLLVLWQNRAVQHVQVGENHVRARDDGRPIAVCGIAVQGAQSPIAGGIRVLSFVSVHAAEFRL